ncbi:MAG: DUF2946 family protein [Rhizomicrobium sp.]
MSRTLKLAGVHIALVAMLLRALLPAGWMPDSASASGAAFVICTVNWPLQAARDAGKHRPGQDDNRQNDVCPFSASVHLATPTVTAVIAPSMRVSSFAPDHAPARTVYETARYSSQSPRAPPSFV